MPWEFTNDRPVYAQLVDEIMLRIISGVYPSGTRIDSVRDLAEQAQVNPNTMQKALQEVERLGLIYSQRTSGKYVTEDEELIKGTRLSIAKSEIEAFISKMNKLGMSTEEIVKLFDT